MLVYQGVSYPILRARIQGRGRTVRGAESVPEVVHPRGVFFSADAKKWAKLHHKSGVSEKVKGFEVFFDPKFKKFQEPLVCFGIPCTV